MTMANGRKRRSAPPKAFIGPLAMLLVGAVASVLLWRTLMLEPAAVGGSEQLSSHDRQALERLLPTRPDGR
jgi:hypothetical protein